MLKLINSKFKALSLTFITGFALISGPLLLAQNEDQTADTKEEILEKRKEVLFLLIAKGDATTKDAIELLNELNIDVKDPENVSIISREVVTTALRIEGVTATNINTVVQAVAATLAAAVTELSFSEQLNMEQTTDAVEATAQAVVTTAVNQAESLGVDTLSTISASATGSTTGAGEAASKSTDVSITTSAVVDAATKGSVIAAAAIATKEDAQVSLPDAVEAATQAVITVATKFDSEAADSDSPSVVESVANTTISTVTALVQEAAADDVSVDLVAVIADVSTVVTETAISAANDIGIDVENVATNAARGAATAGRDETVSLTQVDQDDLEAAIINAQQDVLAENDISEEIIVAVTEAVDAVFLSIEDDDTETSEGEETESEETTTEEESDETESEDTATEEESDETESEDTATEEESDETTDETTDDTTDETSDETTDDTTDETTDDATTDDTTTDDTTTDDTTTDDTTTDDGDPVVTNPQGDQTEINSASGAAASPQ